MNQAAALLMEDISYGGVLENIRSEWMRGQMVGLVGPNGTGKSTLLRLLAGVNRPTLGRIYILGQLNSKISPKDRAKQVAYLPQQMPENASFTVEQYVEMGRFPYRTLFGGLDKEGREAVHRAMAVLNLLPFRNARLDQISGGERQRAGVARCLAQGSPIILLDEPIANLDVHYQLDILLYLQGLAQEGHLIVIAIHHLELAARYCDRLLLLQSGRVYAEGPPQEVLSECALEEVFQVKAKTYADPFGGHLRVSYSP
ncbi:ABC transporter ATP-binding protein [Alicyclobacillus sp. SP_1]|uniref:ABC transporter ATP-binding protein n=1 Tax=Alicyclobacillus sp. SP_1 TaxID=2942475 RepID=UPI00215717F6|nr:ABC transporter ATP-binding protein [Alicyclobacillus sp. SP_1]